MELTYSNQRGGFDPGKRYRNPEHFDKPEAGVTSVLVVGDWPNVVAAYKAAGIDVSVKEVVRVQVTGGSDQEELKELVGKLRAESGAIRALIESAEGLTPLEHPEAGELPIRLFDALTAIHAGIQSLRDDRDVEVEKSRTLQKQVDDLLSQAEQARLETDESKEAKEVAELKTKLDVAGITYRANASKESLQKQVDELSKS